MRDQRFQEERCKELTGYWAKKMGITKWATIRVKFSTDIDGDRIAAECTADWEYLQASIKFNLPTTATMDDEALNAVVVHELVHFLVAPMADKIKNRDAKLEEVSVEQVTRAILRAAR